MPPPARTSVSLRFRTNQAALGFMDEAPKLKVDRADASSAESVAQVCSVLMQCWRQCLREFFERRHPSGRLKEELAQPDTSLLLRRLKIKGLLTDADWRRLYPRDKSAVSADEYDLALLVVLAKYSCGLERPGGGGWATEPEAGDRSQTAAVRRLLGIQRELAGLSRVSGRAADRLFRRIAEQLEVLEDAEAAARVESSRRRRLDEAAVASALDEFLQWHRREAKVAQVEAEGEEQKQSRAHDIPLLQKRLQTRELEAPEGRKRQSLVAKAAADAEERSRLQQWSHIRTGMVLEERRIVDRYYERLLAEVKADAVVEYLMSKEIVTQEESNEIFATLRNNEQMSTLIDFLVPKSGNTFEEFVESFREKNEQLYQQMQLEYMAARADILANKPQSLPYCQETLQHRYKQEYSSWNPIPWYTKVATDIRDFYCSQQLLNLDGKSVEAFEVFRHEESEREPLTVVIEGDPGTGKSTLAKYMAHCWAFDDCVFGRQFRLLLLLDLKVTAPNVKVMMMEQLFGADSKLTEREIWEVIEAHQEDTLLVVDGYEDNLNDEMKSLLFERSLPDLRMLVFSQTNFTVRLMRRYQRKVILTGFAKSQAEEYVQKYVRLARKPWDYFRPFLSKLAANNKKASDLQQILESLQRPDQQNQRRSSVESVTSYSSLPTSKNEDQEPDSQNGTKTSKSKKQRQQQLQQQQQQQQQEMEEDRKQSKIASLRHYAQVPLYCSFFCLLTDMRMSIDLNSPTTIVEQFVSCVKLKLIEREKESRFEANRANAMLSELAMDTMKKGSATFLLSKEDQLMTKFGLIQPATNLTVDDNQRYMFANRLIQEYLAAKYLDTSGTDEASRFFQNMSMTPISYNVVVFYCSLRKSDSDTAATRDLFQKILQFNRRRAKVSRLRFAELDGQLVEGKIMDYQLSLECVAVMDMMRRELSKNISKSLPERITVKHEGIIPRLSLTGLSKMIKLNFETIQEIDLRLDLLAKETLEAYKSLAVAMKSNSHVRTLRIYWTEKDLMADFLRTVCCGEEEPSGQPPTPDFRRKQQQQQQPLQFLQSLECIDESGRRSDQLSPKMLANMRDACFSMAQLQNFSFQNCRHQVLVGCVIRNLPTKKAEHLERLDFSGCEMSIVASQELNSKLVESKSLRSLVLASLKIDSMAFTTFIEAFSSNRTLTLLDLSDNRLDNVCFFSLSEALKINNKLERLYLHKVQMDTRACSELARVLKINKTIKWLFVTEDFVAIDGRRLLGAESRTDERPNRATVVGIDDWFKRRLPKPRANTIVRRQIGLPPIAAT